MQLLGSPLRRSCRGCGPLCRPDSPGHATCIGPATASATARNLRGEPESTVKDDAADRTWSIHGFAREVVGGPSAIVNHQAGEIRMRPPA